MITLLERLAFVILNQIALMQVGDLCIREQQVLLLCLAVCTLHTLKND